MSAAVLLALLAGCTAAVAAVEVAAVRAARRPGPRRDSRPRISLRAGGTALLLALGRRAGTPHPSATLAHRLEAAGDPLGLGVADVMAVKSGGAIGGLLVVAPLAVGLGMRQAVLLFALAGGGGYLLPDAWLRARIRARGMAVERELADVIDLLRVALEAGLSLGRALEEVGRRAPGRLLPGECRRVAREIALGVPSETALARLSARCPAPGARSMASTLARGARHGAPAGRALAALATDARSASARALSERAARAAPKIQLVVALLLVPAVMLIVAAALVATLLG